MSVTVQGSPHKVLTQPLVTKATLCEQILTPQLNGDKNTSHGQAD